ncbi:MAG: phage minor head protein [Bacteroidales bacterium]|nr:phage minor head protein [Bacteroidales bacterium]
MREEHAILDGITLPMDDPFWDEYYVPLGWNCRCQVVQVSKKRYEPSNPSEALARGRAATYKPNADGVNKAAIFRFNPGKEHVVFPNTHPYYKKTSNNNISGNVFLLHGKNL